MTTEAITPPFREIGEVLGQHFTEGQLTALADLLDHGGSACSYAADDLAERADFERRTDGDEEDEYAEESDGYSRSEGLLAELAAAIRHGEREFR